MPPALLNIRSVCQDVGTYQGSVVYDTENRDRADCESG